MTQPDRMQQQQEDWREVLKLPAGRRVLCRLIEMSNALGTSYAPGDALATAHNEGLRRMGLYILTEAKALDPQAFIHILTQGETPHD